MDRRNHNAPNLNIKRVSLAHNKGSLTQRNGPSGSGFKLNVVSTPNQQPNNRYRNQDLAQSQKDPLLISQSATQLNKSKSPDNGLIVRTRDPKVVKQEKIRKMERNLGLLRTERQPVIAPVRDHQPIGKLPSGIFNKQVLSQDSVDIQYQDVEKESMPILLEDGDPREFASARSYFQQQMRIDEAQALANGQQFRIKKLGKRHMSVNQSKVEFEKKRMVREIDEIEHRYRRQIDRRNRLMKELNHLRETNMVYEAIDGEIYGTNNSQMNGSQSGSEMSFMSSNSKFMQTPKRGDTLNFNRTQTGMKTLRSSTNTVRMMTKTSQNFGRQVNSATTSPVAGRSTNFKKKNPLMDSTGKLSVNSSFNGSQKSTQSQMLIQQISRVSISQLRISLRDLEQKQTQENLQQKRLRQVLERERADSIDKQRKITKVKPDVRMQDKIQLKVDKVKYLQQCRKVVAFNTLHTWHKRINDKSQKRSQLIEMKTGQLSEEEHQSNELMSEYYLKLKQLIDVKKSIKEVNQRAEMMRQEQQEEERKLCEKEKQFFVVDRLGLIMLLQKYLHQKRKRRMGENQMELEILRKYYNNRESFNYTGFSSIDNMNEHQSPTKTIKGSPSRTLQGSPSKKKNVYDLMEERIEKLKNYQAYYTQNWGLISQYQFEFAFIEGRYHELLRSLHTRETKYEEIAQNVNYKQLAIEGLKVERDLLFSEFQFFSQFPKDSEDNQEFDGQGILEEKIMEQDTRARLLNYNRENAVNIFSKLSSIMSNIIVRTSYMLKNVTNKVKITYPDTLADIFRKYTVADIVKQSPSNEESPKKGPPNLYSPEFSETGSQKHQKFASSSKFSGLLTPTTPKSNKKPSRNNQTSSLSLIQKPQKFSNLKSVIFTDIKYVIILLLSDLTSLKSPDSLLPAVEHVYLDDSGEPMSVNSSLQDNIRSQYSLVINLAQMFAETKAGIAAEAIQQQKQRAKELQMNQHQRARQPQVVMQAQSEAEKQAEIDEATNKMEMEEVQYMLMGKEQNRLKEMLKKKMEQKQLQKIQEKKQQKLNVMLIENFAKKELTFMNKYKKNSNSAIDNGDHRRVDTFSMANDDKRTIVAGEWKVPTSELQLLQDNHVSSKKKKVTRNLVIKSDMEQSKATPMHFRGMSSATTMAMTMRASNSNSAFNQIRGSKLMAQTSKNISPESLGQRGSSQLQKNIPQIKENGQQFLIKSRRVATARGGRKPMPENQA